MRAMIHRGAHFCATEGRDVLLSTGISRANWGSIEQTPYPPDYEQD
ncbi:hypothetical protein ACPEH1_03830 [Stenotrophomonas sp. NPDC077421]